MQEAMFPTAKPQPGETPEAAAQRVRDEAGRFAKKPPEQAAKPGEQPQKPPAKVDPNAMPEGLTPKAQERFQALANTNKELTAKVQEFQPIVESALGLQQTFREHGVKREQFDQAMQVVGLMNRGDLDGALKVLDEQRALISMALGRPLPGADPLAKFPDLRERVDALQLTEQDALELARNRTVNHGRQQAERQQQEQQEREQRSQQETHQGQLAVDKFCKTRMAQDMDYAKIEPLLLQQIQQGLLEGVPPSRWAFIVEKNYDLIKQTAGMTRTAGPSTSVLRPTGGDSPASKPRTMHEAMWGSKAPA
jgi:hypothetical protein